jgi:hypothetical protein
MKVKVNDNRSNKGIVEEIEIDDNLNLPCELSLFDTFTRLEVHHTYLLKFQFEAIISTMRSYGYEFQGLNCAKDAIHVLFYRTEKHDNITM